ncbi:MAG: hypothetical protein C0408_00260 [Odoribacter sp.]|nr:hypothetical protein [Odoribacter sp.]
MKAEPVSESALRTGIFKRGMGIITESEMKAGYACPLPLLLSKTICCSLNNPEAFNTGSPCTIMEKDWTAIRTNNVKCLICNLIMKLGLFFIGSGLTGKNSLLKNSLTKSAFIQ